MIAPHTYIGNLFEFWMRICIKYVKWLANKYVQFGVQQKASRAGHLAGYHKMGLCAEGNSLLALFIPLSPFA